MTILHQRMVAPNISLVSEDNTTLHFFSPENITYINQDFPLTRTNLAIFIANNLTVITVNVLVLVWLKIKERTLVDRMVLLDCLANISFIGVMFLVFPVRVWGNSYLCILITFFRVFVLSLNRWASKLG